MVENIKFINVKDVSDEMQMELRNWRNTKEITKYFQIEYISKTMHEKWLQEIKKENSSIRAFLIKKDDDYIGLTYFSKIDFVNKTSEWGIYIYPVSYQNKGFGHVILDMSIKYAKEVLKLNKLFLEVLKTNSRAIKLYESFGFKKINSLDKIYRYEKKL